MKRKRVMPRVVVSLLSAIALSTAAQQRQDRQYGALTVLQSGNAVEGAFYDARGGLGSGGVPNFTCIFLLKGTLHGGTATVVTWLPDEKDSAIPGELKFDGDAVSLTLQAEQPGCTSTSGPMVASPWTDTLSRTGENWLDVGMVRADRAVLYPLPQVTSQTRPRLVQYDPVMILQRKPGWVKVIYLYGEKPVTGWLQQSALYPVTTSAHK